MASDLVTCGMWRHGAAVGLRHERTEECDAPVPAAPRPAPGSEVDVPEPRCRGCATALRALDSATADLSAALSRAKRLEMDRKALLSGLTHHADGLAADLIRARDEALSRATVAERRLAEVEGERRRAGARADAASQHAEALVSRLIELERIARRVVAEYRTDLRAGKWSDVLLAAMDDLRDALKEHP